MVWEETDGGVSGTWQCVDGVEVESGRVVEVLGSGVGVYYGGACIRWL